MFKDTRRQGKFLVALFSFIFTVTEDPKKFNDILTQLALSHCRMGVKSCEYGILGEVMFWTLEKCLGTSYTPELHRSWVKIFSQMLKVIIPIAIHHELKNNESQIKRLTRGILGTSNSTIGDGMGVPVDEITAENGNCPYKLQE